MSEPSADAAGDVVGVDPAPATRSTRRGRTLKLGTILVILVGAGLGLTAVTQDWYTATLLPGYAKASVTVSGSDAAPALSALSLAALALAVALAIAGRLARLIVGVLGLVVAVCTIWSAAGSALANAGLVKAVGDATAITGTSAVDRLVSHVGATAWPAVAIAAGVVVAIGALSAVVTGGAWPGASRRYDAVRFDDAGAPVPASARRRPAERPGDAAVEDWDELTRGDDPTAGDERPTAVEADAADSRADRTGSADTTTPQQDADADPASGAPTGETPDAR